jgi:hypothetical protein
MELDFAWGLRTPTNNEVWELETYQGLEFLKE